MSKIEKKLMNLKFKIEVNTTANANKIAETENSWLLTIVILSLKNEILIKK